MESARARHPSANVAAAQSRYRLAFRRVVDLAETLPDDTEIPATPGWTVLDILAHLTGVADDLAHLRVADWSTPERSAQQLEQRQGKTRKEVLEEWAGLVPQVSEILADPASYGLDDRFRRLPLVDLLAHEDDLREAVGTHGRIHDLDWSVIDGHRRMLLDRLVAFHQLPTLRIRTPEGDDWTVGGAHASRQVVLTRQELWRSLTGRRTRDAVASYGWDTPAAPYLECWLTAGFAWPEDSRVRQ